MGTHRLFVAVDLPVEVRTAVDDARRRWRQRLGPTGDAVRWVPPDQLHVTLHFLGDVDDGVTGRLRSVVSGRWSRPCFEMALGGPGVFPPRGHPRVLWLGLSRGASALQELFAEAGSRMTAVAQTVGPRPFRPHLTVGRVRRPGGRGSVALLDAWPRAARPPVWRVDRVVLFESRLSSSGATHERLSQARLADRGSPGATSGREG